MDQATLRYLSERQCAAQWQTFLQCLAEELGTLGSETELRTLAQRTGARFAQQLPLPEAATLADTQLAMSGIWRTLDWGWVELTEQVAHLEIRHYCSPLLSAFGERHALWVGGFLEGVYQQWFDSLGSGTHLRVTQASAFDTLGSAEFRLGQPT